MHTMFHLYLKTHNITGLKYLGYTKNDPFKYKGSGKLWTRHLSKYGNSVKTEVLHTTDCIEQLSDKGLYYSRLWNIVEDPSFANLCEEDGNRLYGKANINYKGHKQSEETRSKISKNNAKVHLGKTGKLHPAYGHTVSKENLDKLAKAREKLKGRDPWNKGRTDLPKHSKETKLKMSKAKVGIKKPIVECPKCGKSGGKPAMMRFHFNNCKVL